ncbi:MAG: chromate resistance protein [Myxococcales bacterium]|nr:chromate resistance protein [Myxococcales bacterium]
MLQLIDTPSSVPPEPRWFLLIHQIPPKPGYLRIKIGRHLQRLGAVAIKNSVYALPASEDAREDLNWVLREIVEGGGDGSIVEASFVEGLSDERVRDLFRAARDAEYQEIAEEARSMRKRGRANDDDRQKLARLQKRMGEVVALDFFGGRQREPTEGLLQELAQRLEPAVKPAPQEATMQPKPQGATWVTRTGIHVDRMASAWLIRRFIDEKAKFKFVLPKSYQHKQSELRFDMFDGEYTHKGDLCTFEVLLDSFKLDDPALNRISEVVHDIDLKDDKHQRPEKPGIEMLVNGIATAHAEDDQRLARASAALDDLYEWFKRKR